MNFNWAYTYIAFIHGFQKPLIEKSITIKLLGFEQNYISLQITTATDQIEQIKAVS